MSQDSMKTAAFQENRRFSHENRTKDHQLPEMVTPMFFTVVKQAVCILK